MKNTHHRACLDFEIARLRQEVAKCPEGRYHLCHAGLLEWIVPVHRDGRLAWMLFAGQRRPSGEFRGLVRDVRLTHSRHAVRKALAPVSEELAIHVLEGLRQLRSRLVQWHHDYAEDVRRGRKVSPATDTTVNRRLVVERYIHDHRLDECSLAGLAHEMKLSESRTIHVVKELFGQSYIQLVLEARLRAAAAFLRETELPVLEVCLGSGFRDISHFHRLFRRRFGVTPLRYRRSPI